MKKLTLLGILAENDYAKLIKFAHSSAVHSISDDDAATFYRDAPDNWKQTLLNACAPGLEAEKVIVSYGDGSLVNLLCIRHGIYPQTVLWAFKHGDAQTAERVLSCLKHKPDEKAEVAMAKRGELELFKLWLDKFGDLEDDTEKLLCEDPTLSTLKSYYIDRQISKGV